MLSQNKVQIFAVAGVLVVLAASLLLMPVNAASVRAITVKTEDGGFTAGYTLANREAVNLVQALQGSKVPDIQGPLVATYDVTLHLRWQPSRHYEVYVNEAREVFLKRRGVNSKVLQSDHPQFFYAHEAFASLYPHSQVPVVQVMVAEQELVPPVQSFDWRFLKWDDQWSSSEADLGSAPPDLARVVNTASQQIEFGVSPSPDRVILRASGPSGDTVYEGPLLTEGWPLTNRNGTYNYELSLFWEEDQQPFRGHYEASFSLEISLPTVYEPPGPNIIQGELGRLLIRHAPAGVEPVLQTNFLPVPQFFPYEDGFVAYFPANYNTKLQEYSISYGLRGATLQEGTFTVRPHNYHVQHMSIDPNVAAATRNDAAYTQFNRYFPPSRETSAPERYYAEPFLIPVQGGRLTTEFGQTRYVNNSPTGSRHSGLDIAAPTGTPILATNSGRVTLSMDLILTGNTIVIDHGQGLFSVHFHLHELHVEKGQLVERGEVIGTVGSTGFSTGPHLHFTMSYYGHNLEPGYFLVGEPVTFANSRQYLGR